MDNKVQALVDLAMPLVGEIALRGMNSSAATVAAAILSRSGNTYTGVCVHLSYGLGFCAEHAAVAEMIKGRETAVDTIVAVHADGIVAPCGRCRELLVQINRDNLFAQVALPGNRVLLLRDLLPHHWMCDYE